MSNYKRFEITNAHPAEFLYRGFEFLASSPEEYLADLLELASTRADEKGEQIAIIKKQYHGEITFYLLVKPAPRKGEK